MASYQDRIDIMILNDSMSRTDFSPVIGAKEKGIIWHMEFLQTETGSWDRILLAAIVYNDIDRVCRVIVYSIDASNPHKASIKLVGRLPFDRKTPLPVLLFPLPCYNESFMVATERSVCVLSADDISCGNVLYPVITTPNTLFDPDTDGEGYLLKLDISDLNNMIWIPCQKLHPMGQEMCMLGLIEIEDGGNSLMAESLLYVGESADSQVIGITWDSDKPTTFVLQTLVNRAPLTDWHVLRKNGQPDKIVCCSGQDEHGALHYLSRDIDSTILYTSDADWNG
ncbi:hypothetical protein BC941DRAFT_344206 [Chlamydoabsidia padenii]|nr:hypothetical protein BC941DRAFT_344206 [Chlamydoabsidia padenii]